MHAVRIQILTALIAYLLQALYHQAHCYAGSLWSLLAEVRATLFQRTSIESEHYRNRRETWAEISARQASLFVWKTSRTVVRQHGDGESIHASVGGSAGRAGWRVHGARGAFGSPIGSRPTGCHLRPGGQINDCDDLQGVSADQHRHRSHLGHQGQEGIGLGPSGVDLVDGGGRIEALQIGQGQ